MIPKKKQDGSWLEGMIYGDMIGGIVFLFFLFILLQQLHFLQYFEKTKIKRLQEQIKQEIMVTFVRNNFIDRIPQIIIDKGNPLHQKILMTNNVMRFNSGDISITKGDDELVLRMVAKVLKKYQSMLQEIVVEGHADTMALGSGIQRKFPTNWELSSGRATTVVRFLTDTTDSSLKINPTKVSSVGLSCYHPINRDSINLNRRIEFVLYYSYEREFMYSPKALRVYEMKRITGEDTLKMMEELRGKTLIDEMRTLSGLRGYLVEEIYERVTTAIKSIDKDRLNRICEIIRNGNLRNLSNEKIIQELEVAIQAKKWLY